MKKTTRLCLQPLEDRLTPAPALLVPSNVKYDFNVATPGMKGTVTYTLTNQGDDPPVDGKCYVETFFSQDPFYSSFDYARQVKRDYFTVGSMPRGVPKEFTRPIEFDPLVLPSGGGPLVNAGTNFNMYVETGGTRAPGNHTFEYAFRFGNVGGKQNVDLRVTLDTFSANSRIFPFSLTGAGSGQLNIAGGQLSLALTGTDSRTQVERGPVPGVTIDQRYPTLTLKDLTAATAVGGVALPEVNVTGTGSFTGGLGELNLHDLGGGAGSQLTLGAGAATTIFLNEIREAGISAQGGLKNLSLSAWLNNGGPVEELMAPFIGTFQTTGDVGGANGVNVRVTGTGPTFKEALDKVTIGGTVAGTWNITNDVGKVTVGRARAWRLTAGKTVDELQVNGDVGATDNSTSSFEAAGFQKIVFGGSVWAQNIRATGLYNPDTDVSIGTLAMGMNADGTNTVKVVTLGNIDAPGGIKKLLGKNWQATTAIRAGWVETLSQGPGQGAATFAASLTLAGAMPRSTNSLKMALFGSSDELVNLSGTWYLAGDVTLIKVSGNVVNWTLNSSPPGSPGSDVGSLIVTDGAVSNTTINVQSIGGLAMSSADNLRVTLRGALPKDRPSLRTLAISELTNSQLDLEQGAGVLAVGLIFNSQIVTTEAIAVFKVAGIKGQTAGPFFLNTNVIANVIGLVIVREVEVAGAADYGITAGTVLTYLRYKDGKKLPPKKNLFNAGTPDQDGRFKLTIL